MNFSPGVILSMILVWSTAIPASTDLQRLRSGAAAGDPWDQLNLGAAYDHGLSGLSADAGLAVYWYRRAAQQGVAKAQFNLAHCLATGHGVDQNYSEARQWMLLAAEQGLADAQFLLAVMIDQGLGGEADSVSAEMWLSRARAQGNQAALQYIKNN